MIVRRIASPILSLGPQQQAEREFGDDAESGNGRNISDRAPGVGEDFRDYRALVDFPLLAHHRQPVQRIKPDQRRHHELEIPVLEADRLERDVVIAAVPAQQKRELLVCEEVGT